MIGESDIYIIVLPTNATLRYPFTTLWAQPLVAPPRITTNNVDISAHLQYIRDKLVEQENELSQLIETEQCEINTLRHSQSLATAQYNGWLAAYQLGFPNCTKLSAAGQTALVITCTPIEITFETEVTSCGPQPRFRNWTINLDGWELVQYSPCYWRMGFVNFNNKPHAYRNGSWIPIEASIVVPEKKLTNTFRYDDIVFFDYEHQSNPAYTDTIIDHMTIMADIAAAMTEHSSNFTEVFITATSSVFGMPNWLANLRSYAILFACIVVILIITRICFKCGCANWFGNYVVVSVDHRQCKVLRFPSKIVIFFSSFVRLRVIILRFRGLCNKTWKLTLQTTFFSFSFLTLFLALSCSHESLQVSFYSLFDSIVSQFPKCLLYSFPTRPFAFSTRFFYLGIFFYRYVPV